MSKTTLQYFAGHTKWYSNIETLCDLCIYLLSDINKYITYAASSGELDPKRLNLKNLETAHFSEAEEEEVFELLQNSPGCEVHFINRKYDTGFRACRLGNWANMYSYIKDYTQVNTQITPLLTLKFSSSALAEKLMKEKLHWLSLSVLRANEKSETPSFNYVKDPVAVIGKMVYK